MRRDMHKVIVERPRVGVKNAPRVKLRHDKLPDRATVGVRRAAEEQGRKTKYLNENLSPLRRYLRKQVGRPWNKVYSEIRENLKADNVVQRHILDHLDDFVERDLHVAKDGTLQPGSHMTWPPKHQSIHLRRKLYVDPHDGILKECGKYWDKLRRQQKKAQPKGSGSEPKPVRLSETEELRRLNGLWYLCTIEVQLDPNKRVWLGADRGYGQGTQRVMVSKRQLSKRDLAYYRVENLHS